MEYAKLILGVRKLVQHRLEYYFGQRKDLPLVKNFKISVRPKNPFSKFAASYKLSNDEQLILALALVPHLNPELYSRLIQQFLPQGGDLPIFGAAKGKHHRGIIPTGETIQFILAGTNVNRRIKVANQLMKSALIDQGMLELENVPAGEPKMSGRLTITPEYVDLLLTGALSAPSFGPDFPAQKIETELSWDDLVLPDEVETQIQELKIWIEFNETLMHDWSMHKKLNPGYRVLFHGLSGTGKTMTAKLLGKHTGRAVFRVDLSTVVSKYIGETEKNLAKLFEKAAHKNWILFFDEADALFGERTEVNDAHDRYSNQEVSYLLQRVENFDGLVILSTNYKSNIDEAFLRRFNAIIKFPFPDAKQREQIWQKSLPEKANLQKKLNLAEIASCYKLTGGSIINAVHQASLQAISKRTKTLTQEDLLHGIKREVEKEGKVFSSLSKGSLKVNRKP